MKHHVTNVNMSENKQTRANRCHDKELKTILQEIFKHTTDTKKNNTSFLSRIQKHQKDDKINMANVTKKCKLKVAYLHKEPIVKPSNPCVS